MKSVVTYLNFDGNCRQAMEFYAECLGADVELMPFSSMPGEACQDVDRATDRIMHARLSKGGTLVIASDTMPGMPFRQGNNFNICIDCEGREEIERLFAALGENGSVSMPLQNTFWGAYFGMLTDQFGIGWMLNYELPKQG